MKSNADQQPDRIYSIGENKYHFVFNLEAIEIEGRASFNYDVVEINSTDYEEIVRALIADKYSQADETALINNFNADKSVEEYVNYQHYREVCKLIAQPENLFTSDQIQQLYAQTRKIKITLPLGKVVSGGAYFMLADMMMKKRAIFSSTDTTVTAWVSFLLPEHQAILQADPEVIIE